MSSIQSQLIAIYTTRGDAEAFLMYPHLFNRGGEWIGFVTSERDVYSVLGEYVGILTDERRIIRQRAPLTLEARLAQHPPRPPAEKIYPPATIPLPPMMSELSHSLIDVLQEAPERLHTLDCGENREDMD
jgi:hypothetical protein